MRWRYRFIRHFQYHIYAVSVFKIHISALIQQPMSHKAKVHVKCPYRDPKLNFRRTMTHFKCTINVESRSNNRDLLSISMKVLKQATEICLKN